MLGATMRRLEWDGSRAGRGEHTREDKRLDTGEKQMS